MEGMKMPPTSSYTGACIQPLNSNSQSSSLRQGQPDRDGRRYKYYRRTRKSNREKPEESKTPFEEWEEAREEKKINVVEYRAFLESCDFIKANTQWREVQDRLEDDERCLRLDRTDRLEVFQEYICDLEKEEQKIEKEQLRRNERKNRDDFRRLMENHKATGLLTVNTHWLDYFVKVKNHPAYLAMATNTSGSPPKDLFEDVIEEMKKQYQEDKENIKDSLKAGKLTVTSALTRNKCKASIDELVFEEVLEKEKEKEEKEVTIDCPSEILAEFAKGPFDPESPLKQFATKLQDKSRTCGSTRRWKCNICGVERFGSMTRVNAHLLFIRGKGVRSCAFLEQASNVKYRIEIKKLCGLADDNTIAMPSTYHRVQQSKPHAFSHILQKRAKVMLGTSSNKKLCGLADDNTIAMPSTYHRVQQSEPHAFSHTLQKRAKVMLGTSSKESVVVQSLGVNRKHKLQSNPIGELFNVQLKDDIDASIGKFFFANGIPFHVARSHYYKEMILMVAKGGPSYVPPNENRLKTTCAKRVQEHNGM